MSIQNIPANVSGLNMRTLTNSNFTDLDGRATTQLADIVALTAGKAPKIVAYPEDFGAVRNGTTDDTAALQAAITSLAGSGGTVQLSTGTYKTTAPLTVPSYVNIEGISNVDSTIHSTSTTTDIIQLVGSAANCASGSILWNSFRNFGINRSAQATAGDGFHLVNTCYASFFQVYSFDSVNDFYISGCGNTHLTSVYAGWNTPSTTVVRNGIFLDSSVNSNQSTIIDGHSVSNGGGANGTGLLVQGACIADLFVYGFETAIMTHGVHIKSTLGNGLTLNTCNADLHLTKLILDQIQTNGIWVENVNGGGVPSVQFSDCHFQTSSGGAGVRIASSRGVTVVGSQFDCRGSGARGVYAGSSAACSIAGNNFNLCETGVELNGTSTCAVNNNNFDSTSDNPIATHIVISNGSVLNSCIGNVINGSGTNGITISSDSLGNVCYPNIVNSSLTNSIVSAGGKGNVTFGPGFSTPVVTGDGTLGANSTNCAGFITSNKTGASVITLTFDLTRMGSNIGYSCAVSNLTTANLIRQTSTSSTAVTIEGVTNSGDVISYAVTEY